MWSKFGTGGLLGIHEGTLLSEDAEKQGIVTDNWTLDSAEAPRERDWISAQEMLITAMYFASEAEALDCKHILCEWMKLKDVEIKKQAAEDWDAQWKAHFLNSEDGLFVPPFWRILPAWNKTFKGKKKNKIIRINPGAGFGTGTHETTQLCLEALGRFSEKNSLSSQSVLDFGSGSGILSIAAAMLGAEVDAVEIDHLAIDNSRENSELNGQKENIVFSRHLPKNTKSYTIIVANILRPVLIQFSEILVTRLITDGGLILCGLLETDLEQVSQVYSELMHRPHSEIVARGEWRALIWHSARVNSSASEVAVKPKPKSKAKPKLKRPAPPKPKKKPKSKSAAKAKSKTKPKTARTNGRKK